MKYLAVGGAAIVGLLISTAAFPQNNALPMLPQPSLSTVPQGLNFIGNISYSGSAIASLGNITGGSGYTSGTALLSLGSLTAGGGTLSSGVFTQTASNAMQATDTMSIGGVTYTFVSAIGAAPGNVLIGANFAASMTNLAASINCSAGGGTTYIANSPCANPKVSAVAAATTETVTALNVGVSIVSTGTTYTASGTSAGSWGASTLAGNTYYTPGLYFNVPVTDLTTGAATGAAFTVTIGNQTSGANGSSWGKVTNATLINGGSNSSGYLVNDSLTVSNSLLGGVGSGFSIPVATTGAFFSGVATTTRGNGIGATLNITILSTGTAITGASLGARGTGYATNDTLSVTAASVGGAGSGFSIPVSGVGSAATPPNAWITLNSTLSGTVAGVGANGEIAPFNLYTSSDAVVTGGANLIDFDVEDLPRNGATGNRIAIEGHILLNGSAEQGNINYVGVWGIADAEVNLGGTNTGAGSQGLVFGMNPQAKGGGTATNLTAIIGEEVDISCGYGCTTKGTIGVDIVQINGDQTVGATTDAALMIGSAVGSPGWTNGILINNYNGQFPISSSGNLLETSAGTVNHGLHLTNLTCTTDCYASNGAKIDGSGNATFANVNVTSATIPTNGIYAYNATTIGFGANSSSVGYWNIQQFAFNHANNAQNSFLINNGSSGVSAQAAFIFGNSSSATEAVINLNGGSFSGGLGANALSITSAGNFYIIGGSTTGLEIDSSGNPYMPSLANVTTAKAGSVCWTTSTGALTYDGTNTCLVSSARFKEDIEPIRNALSEVLAIKPVSFRYKNREDNPDLHVGFLAENVADVDPRFVVYGDDGRPLKLRLMEMPALAFGAIQQQQDEIAALTTRVRNLEHRH